MERRYRNKLRDEEGKGKEREIDAKRKEEKNRVRNGKKGKTRGIDGERNEGRED